MSGSSRRRPLRAAWDGAWLRERAPAGRDSRPQLMTALPIFGLALGGCLAEIGPALSIDGGTPGGPRADGGVPTTGPDGGAVACPATPDPRWVTLHRLNRAEYDNTVRDLLGTASTPAVDFPADDHGYGFDNIGDVLATSSLLVEKWQLAAEKLVLEALGEVETVEVLDRYFEAEALGGSVGAETGSGWNLWANGEISMSIPIATAGDYAISVRAFQHRAGSDPARMELRVDGRVLRTFDVPAEAAAPGTYELTTRLAAGGRAVTVAFVNDYYAPNDPDPNNRDRNLVVDWIRVRGPADPPRSSGGGPGRAAIFVCTPTDDADTACARTILRGFARRAWRRPPTEAELDRMLTVVQVATAEGDPIDQGIAIAMEAILLSPHFVFRVEVDPESAGSGPHPLSDHELATRLSYFLWSSMPDAELAALADGGRLSEPATLSAQVRRMLADPKALALTDNFVGQWLYTRALDNVNPDYAVYPTFDAELRAAMREETRLFFREFLTADRSALDLLDAPFTYLNERLALHYGIPGVTGAEMRRVELTTDARGGLLRQGSLLTVTSQPRRTSPVKRGKFILEQLLCRPPDDPPANVGTIDGADVDPNATLRERLAQHRENPFCAECHNIMDPLGLGFENYDGIGAFRTTEAGQPVDASGQLVSGERFSDARQLIPLIKADDGLARCMTEKLATYALGRGTTEADRCALDAMTADFAAGGHRFEALIRAVVTSPTFLSRRRPE